MPDGDALQHSYEYIDEVIKLNPSYEVQENQEATAELPDYCNEDPKSEACVSLLRNRGSLKKSNSADDILEQSRGLELPQYDMANLNTRWSLSSIEDEDSEPLSNGDSSSQHLPTPTSEASQVVSCTYYNIYLAPMGSAVKDGFPDTPANVFLYKVPTSELHPQSTGCERKGVPKSVASAGDLSTAGSIEHARDAEKRDTPEIPLSFDQIPEKVSWSEESGSSIFSGNLCNTQSKDRDYYNLYFDGDYHNFSKSLPLQVSKPPDDYCNATDISNPQASSKQHRDRLASVPPGKQKKPIALSRGPSGHIEGVRQEEAGRRSSPPVTPRRNRKKVEELPSMDCEKVEAENRPSPLVSPQRVMVKMEQLPTFDLEKVWQQEPENIPSPPVTPRRRRRIKKEDSSGIADGPKSPPVSPQRSQIQDKESGVVAMPSPTITPRKLKISSFPISPQ